MPPLKRELARRSLVGVAVFGRGVDFFAERAGVFSLEGRGAFFAERGVLRPVVGGDSL